MLYIVWLIKLYDNCKILQLTNITKCNITSAEALRESSQG